MTDDVSLTAGFWAPIPLPEIPFLQSLYDVVLERSEKRMPKWKFRLGPDIVIEIQPKLTRTGRLFHWSAIQCDGANEKMFAEPRTKVRPYIKLGGSLRDVDDGRAGYVLKTSSGGWSAGLDLAACLPLRGAIEAAFREGRFDRFTPSMLGNHCLLCGKGLTDPVSMARFIGPECANTSSVNIPWLREATEASESAVAEQVSDEQILRMI
jgi:Family of unknown function (DUF6011)